MATLTEPDNDEKLNPASWDESTGQRLSSAEQDSFDDISNNFDKTADDSQENSNIDRLKNAEERGSKRDNVGRSAAGDQKSKDDSSGGAFGNTRKLAMSTLRKKGPLALIGAIVSIVGAMFTVLTSPGLLIVQIKDALTEDLNDAITAMDTRSQHIIKAKMKKATGGFCTQKVSMRCKYKSMSTKQIEKLRKAGVHVESSGKTLTGRHKVSSLALINPENGERIAPDKPGGNITAREFMSQYNNSTEFRSRMNTAWTPRWMSVRDDTAKKVMTKFKVKLQRNINGKDEKEMKRQYNEAVKDGTVEDESGRKATIAEDEDGNRVYKDADGNTITDPDGNPIDVDESEKQVRDLQEKSGGSLKSKLGSGLRGLNSITGTQASYCNIYRLLRTAGTVSRNLKYTQLIRYAVPFMNTADSIKNGTATPEAVAFLGGLITAVDLRKNVFNSDALEPDLFGTSSQNNTDDALYNENKHYGKTGTDSAGLKAAMYGESRNVDMRESQASLSGGGGSKLAGIGNKLKTGVGGVSIGNCNIWENPLVQAGSIALSVGMVIASGGSSAPVQIAKAGATIAIEFALMAYFTSMISDIANGDLFDADTDGLDMGNALFAGSGALFGSLASSRGMRPLSTKDEIKSYQKVTAQVKQQQYEVDKLAAASSPFDMYNKASFLGSMAWDLSPIMRQSSSTVASVASVPLQLVGSATSWLSPMANAALPSDISRYGKWTEDAINQEMNLQVSDVMGNSRYGMSEDQLQADPQKVAQWMIDARQVDADSGEVLKTKDALEAARDLPNQPENEIAYLRDTDNDGVDQELADSNINATNAAQTASQVPYPVDSSNPDLNERANNEPEKDVRTYAHFLRYCRYGIEDGRKVNFGDEDTGPDASIFQKINPNGTWRSTGKECFKSNSCDTNGDGKNDKDPNGDNSQGQDQRYQTFCRPTYYDIYEVYTLDKSIDESFDLDDEASSSNESEANGLVTGEAKELAGKVANNPNIEFTNPATKEALIRFSETGEATNFCGQKFGIDAMLSGVLLANANKYKILINNFGFKEDRFVGCDNGEHPKGKAVDLNGVKKLDGSGDAWGNINFSGSQTAVITDYSIDWMDALATKDDSIGRVGQLNCGGFNLINKKKPNWKGHDGLLHFDDACNHLHIDVGEREL